jgi:hypothetical protein
VPVLYPNHSIDRQIAWIYAHDKARMLRIMTSAAYACVR